MKLKSYILASIIASGMALAALVAPTMAEPGVMNDLGETNCLDAVGIVNNAMCTSDETISPAGVGHELIAMNDSDPWDPLMDQRLDNGLYFGAKTVFPAKSLLPQPINVAAGVFPEASCSDETIAPADNMMLMTLPDVATTDICLLDISGDGSVGLSTTT